MVKLFKISIISEHAVKVVLTITGVLLLVLPWIEFVLRQEKRISYSSGLRWGAFGYFSIPLAPIAFTVAAIYCFGFVKPTATKRIIEKADCFIATAAYGTPVAREIDVIRAWRDDSLLSHPLGRFFVKIYYILSPPIAYRIQNKHAVRKLIRTLLGPFIRFLE